MVNVVNNSLGKSNVVYNVGNNSVVDIGSMPNNLEAMAGQVGLIDAAHQLNQESREEDQFLREQTFENYAQPPANDFDPNNQDQNEMYEEQQFDQNQSQDFQSETQQTTPRKSSKKKKDGNKRFDTMAVNLAQRIKERDEALERALYLEQELIREKEARLGITHTAYDRQVDQITDLLIGARRDGDFEAEKAYTKALSEAQAAKNKVQENQRILQDQLIEQERISSQKASPASPVLQELFDKRELTRLDADDAEGLMDWLARNPACNPNSPDFDEEYAGEVAKIKKAFTKTYIRSGESNLIGENEYYHELDQILDHQFGRRGNNKMTQDPRMMPPAPNYSPQQQQNQYGPNPNYQRGYAGTPPPNSQYPYQQPQYGYPQQNYAPQPQQTNMPRMYTVPIGNNPPVSRVNRAGYGNGTTYGAPQYLPQLDAVHREIAMRIPYTDAQGNTITDPNQRIRLYQQDLANEQGSGGNYGY